ncbi:hypothetical protein, partial [Geoglobus sp.]
MGTEERIITVVGLKTWSTGHKTITISRLLIHATTSGARELIILQERTGKTLKLDQETPVL